MDALTAEDKAAIKAMATEEGLNVKFTSRCKNCYIDALVLLRQKYCVAASDGNKILTPSGNFYWLHGTSKMIWWYKGSKITLSAMSADSTIEAYIAVYPCQKDFERVEVPAESESGSTGENDAENGANEEGGEQ